MKTFPSIIVAAILALCLTPALAFAQEDADQAQTPLQTRTAEMKLNLIQSGDYAANDQASCLSTQASSPLSDDEEAEIKERFATACENVESSISVSDLNIVYSNSAFTRLRELLSELVNSRSDLFYVNNSLGVTFSRFFETLQIGYSYSKTEIESMKPAYSKALDEVLSWVPEDASEAYKAKAVHDWLVRNCEYNLDARDNKDGKYQDSQGNIKIPNPWNAYGALVDKKPVCQGYSLAFCAAMSKLGIACTYVGQDGAGHGWNRVKIDGSWYNLDVTFDDPTPDRGPKVVPYTTYFLKSDAWFQAKENLISGIIHASWEPVGEPATDTRYDGYVERDWPTYNAPADNGSTPSTPTSPDPEQTKPTKPTTPTAVPKTTNPTKVTGKTINVKFKKLKKKKKLTFNATKAYTVSKAPIALKYAFKYPIKKISVASNGTITLKKGLKKDRYSVVVAVTAPGTNAYYPLSTTAIVTINVK